MPYKSMKKGSFDWASKYKEPKTMDYHPSKKEYCGMQYGNTVDYVERTEKSQEKQAGKIRNQNFNGRYE